MISFINDYSENSIPEILEKIVETNLEGNKGYSNDKHSKMAKRLIIEKIKNDKVEVQILTGGTQANLVAIAAFLRPHEAIITCKTGHINVHETGAIEATGHKCIGVKGYEGKVTPNDIDSIFDSNNWEQAGILTVKPKLVYISQCTELGTVYSEEELILLRKTCDKYNLYLYCDGARLGSALACSNVTFPLLAKVCDAFYIGGTKNGALFGEALVIVNEHLQKDFRYIAKQRGGMLAKGWLLGIQFEVLMKDNIYIELGRKANKMADLLRNGLELLGIEFYIKSKSNQIFVIMDNDLLSYLKKDFEWETIDKINEKKSVIRLVTSWATKEKEILAFLERIKNYFIRKDKC